ncbi:accessory Sec system glycosyltransferase GtfA [Lactobacillus delbrueckii]|uniref:accessory Sec system glycosyltransferase GtfA n=1 Tax=Lactobacillus delbrueckii TaxID=1584 RepID=UPI001E51862D|nr:accessory Sec system glycosyltransferase GtfA [Lactobacillus delbrueckii]MCD5439822.1 accessory Sec system glycosyltransferase GtfA [Lactobacillus delbrueckii subsp. lactis]
MTVYSINKGIGWASSGVEYAQAYRCQVFRKLGMKAKFIFTDWISYENIAHLTRNLGFEDKEIIWLYTFFTDFKIRPGCFTLSDLEKVLPPIIKCKHLGKAVRYIFANDFWATAYLKDLKSDIVDRVEYVSGANLVRKDYYSYGRYCSEFYAPENNRAKLYQRRFYNEDGTTAYDEIIDGDQEVFKFKDEILHSKHELLIKMLQELNFSKEDIILIDRAGGQGQEILENRGKAQVGTVIHAEHFSEAETNDTTILWNNYYEYTFEHDDQIDFYVTATDLQKKLMEEQFLKYKGKKPQIYVIPVGSLNELKKPDFASRKPFSLVTASRLASEKHLDWAIRAVAKANKSLPQLSLDIYGAGSERSLLEDVIKEVGAEDYVHLKGHQQMDDIYQYYQAYLSCSTSEGFGLTLMEAVGSGLAMVGFDVRYGNQTFIADKENGLLLPYDRLATVSEYVNEVSQAIIKLFSSDLAAMSEKSYAIADKYNDKQVAQLWKGVIESELHCD